MSSQEEKDVSDGDLIDFQVASPELPRAKSSPLLTDLSGNLIDSELPVLEKTLQNSSEIIRCSSTSSQDRTVDVEDILIDLENDSPAIEFVAPSFSRSDSQLLFDIENESDVRSSISESKEKLEALNVLLQLDELLNHTLEECDHNLSKSTEDLSARSSSSKHEESIEECLKDLDNYLQEYENEAYQDLSSESRESLSRTKTVLHSLAQMGVTQSPDRTVDSVKMNRDLFEKLVKQLNATGYLNLGYESHPEGVERNNEIDVTAESELRRSLSSASVIGNGSSEIDDALNANHRPRNNTVAAVSGRQRHRLHRDALCSSSSRKTAPVTDNYRISAAPGAAGPDSDEEIDWSWVQDVARDINRERLAHAAGDCGTGSVVVEPIQRASSNVYTDVSPIESEVTQSSSLGDLEASSTTRDISSLNSSYEADVDTDVMVEAELKEDRRVSNNWLRSSMRRLRHFRLPSDGINPSTDNQSPVQTFENSENVRIDMPPAEPQVPVTVQRVVNNPVVTETINTSVVRPFSAPSRIPSQASTSRARSRSRESRVSNAPNGRARSSSASSRSRRPRSLSSSVSSLASSVDSSPSSIPTPVHVNGNQEQPPNVGARSCERTRANGIPEAESPLGQWPHSLSSMLACLGCSLGLFNISRFAILSIHFGANFIFQFFFLSMLIGLPLFTLQLCLGQQLGAGVIDMWRISPLFQGVGISLLAAQAMIGIYSIIGVSWMFVYFRDSFITKMDRYRWAEPFSYYRHDLHLTTNGTFKLTETIPDYLSGIVLQRQNLASGHPHGTIKFQPAFNLAVIWMIIFVSLSKGLRSYGKVIYVFTLIPVFGTFILCAKLLGMMPPELIHVHFPETSWSEFFLNSKSWLAASQEVFLTWGLLGAAVMQIASHNKNKHLLRRDSSLIAVITFTILLLVAFLANTCVQILRSYGYSYQPDSFEKISTYTFMRSLKDPLPPSLAGTPVRYMIHNSFIVGERVARPGIDLTSESGYHVLRFATELIPAAFSLLGPDQISPFWAVLFYFILILFGIAQQLAIWHCLITGIMAIKAKVLKSWETTITFFSCACGFVLGLPMTTEFGIYVVYFLDLTVGGSWWLILVILLQILAVFMVRGRPYSGDTVVTALFKPSSPSYIVSWAPALLSFTWNVVLPVALTILCIVTFKNGNFRELFIWHHAPSLEYWPLWARQLGSMLQLLPVLCIPLVAVIQSYRYLNNGPPDILDRIQLLYRPPIGEHMEDLAVHEATNASLNNNTSAPGNAPSEDPPPKYTPPPSYTTATGARIAKMLRQSIRRSVRRIANALGESSTSRQRNTQSNLESQPPPPDYNTVLVEMNQNSITNIEQTNITIPDINGTPNQSSLRRHLATFEGSSNVLTAADVASILRNSFRRSTLRTANNIRRNASLHNDNSISSLSAENLVDYIAPIGETSLVLEQLSRGENERDLKPTNDNLASVI